MSRITIDVLERQAEHMGVKVLESDIPGTTCGLYCERLNTIWLADWLNDRQRLCTLCHELVHAKYRDLGCGTRFGVKCERRARRETALTLIDTAAYSAAESVWDANSWRMACELGVTESVLQDYRTLVLPNMIRS
ncbi:ImmA/IrrE family metallo-endopeptidase [Bifidobacterium bifidum]|jgi:Zn-dependent peptidase ImmA (M78 family)|uniref:ImmA/IrrE family metallo-endopeptidase n=1 Tax=Bifidobacterium bifidum TaxID=1681 RepID=UPI0034A4C5B4